MRQVTQYQCEICGTMYNDVDKCEACENGHVAVNQVQSYRYIPINQGANSKYPVSVTILMEDGTTATFKR